MMQIAAFFYLSLLLSESIIEEQEDVNSVLTVVVFGSKPNNAFNLFISYIAIDFSLFPLPHFHNPVIYRSYLDVKAFFCNLVVLMVGEQQQVGALRLAMSQK